MSDGQVEWPEWPEFIGSVAAQWRGEGQADARQQQPRKQTEASRPVWNISQAHAVPYAYALAADTQILIAALERWSPRVHRCLRVRLGRRRCHRRCR